MKTNPKAASNLQSHVVGISAVISDRRRYHEMARFVSKLSLSVFAKGGRIMQVYDPVFSPLIVEEAGRFKSAKGEKPFQMLIDDRVNNYIQSDPFFSDYYQDVTEIKHIEGANTELDPVYRHLIVHSDVLIIVGNQPAGALKDVVSPKLLERNEELRSPFYMIGIGEDAAQTYHSRIRTKRPDWHIDDDEMRDFATCNCSAGKVPSLVEHVFDRWDFAEEREKKKLFN